MKTFGERIRTARLAKGLTLEALAKVIKSHKGYVSGIENGKVNAPSHKLIPALCRRLGLPVEEMAALAWWEKRSRGVTLEASFRLLEGLISESLQPTPPGEEAADKKLIATPATAEAPKAEAV